MAWSREAGGGTTDLSPLLGSPLLPWRAGRTGHCGRQRGPRSQPPLGEQEGPGQAVHPVHSASPSGWSDHMLVASLSHPAAPCPVPPLRPGLPWRGGDRLASLPGATGMGRPAPAPRHVRVQHARAQSLPLCPAAGHQPPPVLTPAPSGE